MGFLASHIADGELLRVFARDPDVDAMVWKSLKQELGAEGFRAFRVLEFRVFGIGGSVVA